LLASHVARAENRVGVPVEQRPDQPRIFAGIVLQVGVLNQREIAGGLFDGAAYGRALAAIYRVLVEPDLRKCGSQALQDRLGAICGTIIDDDQFPIHVLG
jgi:hypothetical protein